MQSRDAGIPDPTSPPHSPHSPRCHPAHSGPVAGRVGAAAGAHPAARPLPPRPPALASAPDLGALLKALKRRWLTALGLGLMLAGAIGSAAWMLLTPKFTAFAQVHVLAGPDEVVGGMKDAGGGENRTGFVTYLKTQVTQLQSRFVFERALNRDEVKRLNLDRKHPNLVHWLEQELKVETQPDSEYIKLMLSLR